MSCTSQSQQQLLESILETDSASFDRLQQANSKYQSSVAIAGDYGYFYNLEVSATVAPEAPFPFDTNGAFTSGFLAYSKCCSCNVSSYHYCKCWCIYSVQWSVTVAEARQIALFLNGAVVAGTTVGAATGTVVTSSQAIITATAGSLLTLRNHTSVAALTLVTPSGGTAGNNTNSILIKQLA